MIKLSRSKLELFLDCPRCFWLEVNKGVKRPPSFPYTINSAIDSLLKKEFDLHRQEGTPHYLIKKYNINAIPYKCKEIDTWRYNFTGIQFHHQPTDFLVFGAIDDIWINYEHELLKSSIKFDLKNDEYLIVVDKASNGKVIGLKVNDYILLKYDVDCKNYIKEEYSNQYLWKLLKEKYFRIFITNQHLKNLFRLNIYPVSYTHLTLPTIYSV